MKVRTRVQMGKKDTGSPGACLRIGGAVFTLRCGLAYAGNSIMRGDAYGIGMGLGTVTKTTAETERIFPSEKKLIQSIKSGVEGLTKLLKPGKTIPKKTAQDMLSRIRDLGDKVTELHAKSVKICV